MVSFLLNQESRYATVDIAYSSSVNLLSFSDTACSLVLCICTVASNIGKSMHIFII